MKQKESYRLARCRYFLFRCFNFLPGQLQQRCIFRQSFFERHRENQSQQPEVQVDIPICKETDLQSLDQLLDIFSAR